MSRRVFTTGEAESTAASIGAVEWFEPGEHDRVERVVEELRRLGIEHLRTGVSWANWHAPGGRDWYDWLLPRLARDLSVLPCVVYTPPSLGIAPKSGSPPRRTRDYADFLDFLISAQGATFEYVELWNEPNNIAEWDWRLDLEWSLFAQMIREAGYWVRRRGKKSVLGGMSPLDKNWLSLMAEKGALADVDVIGIHGFPGTWEISWEGWNHAAETVRDVLDWHALEAEIWITEAGFSTWRHDEFAQVREFVRAVEAPVARVYWYSVEDLDPERSAIGGFHTDVRHYHMGLHESDGRPKLLARLLTGGGVDEVRETYAVAERRRGGTPGRQTTLITGGAGFVGTNLAGRLLEDGADVCVLDNLARPGAEQNLRWLRDRYGARVSVEAADIRDEFALRRALRAADAVFHLAAQVAVSTSLARPLYDLGVNLEGTVRLLEELRRLDEPPPFVFTSTSKVYGALPDLELVREGNRWEPVDQIVRSSGLSEDRPLDFCTPSGCAKGAADQYVLDYAKSFGLRTVVLRMSCSYGPHQHGTEDQAWVAHFLLQALAGAPITVYGDGAQVRDVLFVDDLIDALLLACEHADQLSGRAFNIGGGSDNSVSLLELIDLIGELHAPPRVRFATERPGDRRYFVCDTTRFEEATGWAQRIPVRDGVATLYRRLIERGRVLEAAR